MKFSWLQCGNVYDEFVELYNPGNASVDLTNWYIQKRRRAELRIQLLQKRICLAGKLFLPMVIFWLLTPLVHLAPIFSFPLISCLTTTL